MMQIGEEVALTKGRIIVVRGKLALPNGNFML
jgi:hypothetical protein